MARHRPISQDYEARLQTTEMNPPFFGLDPALQLEPGEDINGKTC